MEYEIDCVTPLKDNTTRCDMDKCKHSAIIEVEIVGGGFHSLCNYHRENLDDIIDREQECYRNESIEYHAV